MEVVLKKEEHTILEELTQSPKLSLYFREIERILRQEQQKREDFYNLINEGDKAEFINGESIFHSPVKLRHNQVGKLLLALLDAFARLHNLGYVGYEKIMLSLSRNDYEPDICFFSQEISQHFSPEQIRFPAPDFIAEILSESTEDIDRGIKFEDYAAHGVSEYWIVDPKRQIVEQYALGEAGSYELKIKSDTGYLKSVAVAGFEIPVRALFDKEENLKALQAILA